MPAYPGYAFWQIETRWSDLSQILRRLRIEMRCYEWGFARGGALGVGLLLPELLHDALNLCRLLFGQSLLVGIQDVDMTEHRHRHF